MDSPPINLEDLRRIPKFFPRAGFRFSLDPSFEPMSGNANDKNTKKFAVLQRYIRVNLVVPVDSPHMFTAAIEGKACKLTALGEHYRRLAESGLL